MFSTFIQKLMELLGFFLFIAFGAIACTGGAGTDGSLLGSGIGPVGQAAPEMDSGVVGPIVDRPICMTNFNGQLTHEPMGSDTETHYRLKGQVFDFSPQEIQVEMPDGTTVSKIDNCAGLKAVEAGQTVRIVMDDGSWYLEKKLAALTDSTFQEAFESGGVLDVNFEGPSSLQIDLYLSPEGYEPGQELAWLPCQSDQEFCVPDQGWQHIRFLNLPTGIKNWGPLESNSSEKKSRFELQKNDSILLKSVAPKNIPNPLQTPPSTIKIEGLEVDSE